MSSNRPPTFHRTPTEVTYIANHWLHLQPHIREAIMTLVDGALTAELGRAGCEHDIAVSRKAAADVTSTDSEP